MTSGTDETVEQVLVMFKCHLDVGFTDTEATVLRQYVELHLPRAIEVAAALRQEGADRYVWTVPAWLLHRYLQQADPAARARAETAIRAGDLVWHALPFTWYTELLDPTSIAASLGFSRWLDERFGKTTTAARLTDVPGHSRGLIGPLADAGVTFLDVGVNPGCRAPAVPFVPGVGLPESDADQPDPDLVRWHDAEPVHADRGTPEYERRRLTIEGANSPRTHLFTWRDPAGRELTVLYHPTSYGSTVRLPTVPVALSMRVHGDNLGPHSLESVRQTYASLRRKFPRATVRAADLSTIGDAIAPVRGELPVLEAEIGDTWIYGTGADPAKTGDLRELLRLRAQWLRDGRLHSGDETDLAFLAELIPAPEHNWGLSTSVYLRSWHGYRTDELAHARTEDLEYGANDAEWAAKRRRPADAAAGLPEPLRSEAVGALTALREPVPPAPAETSGADPVLDNGLLRLRVDPTTGGLAELRDLRTGRDWAGDGLAVFGYQAFAVADYRRFAAQYNYAAFTENDFGKPGLDAYPASPLLWSAAGAAVGPGADGRAREVELHGPPEADDPERLTAWPARVVLHYVLAPDRAAVHVRCSVVGKPANRRPEALWLSFQPATGEGGDWRLDKLGQPLDPDDVVSGGGRYLHGVGRGARYTDARGGLDLETLDAHLVSPGGRNLLRHDDQPLDLRGGLHVNLYNNLWGTAFPQWYDLDMRFRFTLTLRTPQERSDWWPTT